MNGLKKYKEQHVKIECVIPECSSAPSAGKLMRMKMQIYFTSIIFVVASENPFPNPHLLLNIYFPHL